MIGNGDGNVARMHDDGEKGGRAGLKDDTIADARGIDDDDTAGGAEVGLRRDTGEGESDAKRRGSDLSASSCSSSSLPPHGVKLPRKFRIQAKVRAQEKEDADAEAKALHEDFVRGKGFLHNAVEALNNRRASASIIEGSKRGSALMDPKRRASAHTFSSARGGRVSFRIPQDFSDRFEDEVLGNDDGDEEVGRRDLPPRQSILSRSGPLSSVSESRAGTDGVPTSRTDSLMATTSASRRSSLTLRKVPEHILLGPCDRESTTEIDDDSFDGFSVSKEVEVKTKSKTGMLQRTCLHPTFPLRRQMMLSFGVVSALTVLLVIIVSVAISISSGDAVRSVSKDSLQFWARDKASSSARYVSDAFAPMMPGDIAEIIYEAARDRFVGYPDHPGYEEDALVPFRDMDSGRNIYPLDAPLNKLDWDTSGENVNATNAREHVGERYSWYAELGALSTETSMYHMQGACNPSARDRSQDAMNFVENCTDAHNDAATGGVINPVPTNEGIYRRSKDLTPLFKALYESSPVVKELGLLFANAGAGSSFMFPHYAVDYRFDYSSAGCEWMNEPNPYDPSQPVGTPEEIARCQPKGTLVKNERYNVLERGWCRDQALSPDRMRYVGPYLNAWAEHEWLMLAGRAVYDRVTNKFIACMFVDINLVHIPDILEEVKIGDGSRITLVKWDDEGTVVASPGFDYNVANETTTVDDPVLDVGVDRAAFESLKSKVDFDSEWDPAGVKEAFENSFIAADGKIVSSYPVPPPPDEYDPKYYPDFMVIVTLDDDYVFRSFYDLDAAVDDEVKDLITFTLVLGFAGLAAVMCIILLVSVYLTKPLNWMNDTADLIVNNFGSDFKLGSELEKEEVFRFSPRTELADLIKEFRKLVSRFSGEGTARAVRFGNKLTEVKNRFTMLDEFEWLYQSRKGAGFKFSYDVSSTSAPPRQTDSGRITWSTKMEEMEEEGSNNAAADVPRRQHFGPNFHNLDSDSKSASVVPFQHQGSVLKSPLFRWIVGLIVLPLVIITVTITAVVTWKIKTYFTDLDEVVRTEYLELEKNAMTTFALLRTIQAAQLTTRAVRDLHVHTRVAGWLLFGGLGRSESFTMMHTNGEECKVYPDVDQCPHIANATCVSDTEEPRYNQSLYFEGQRQDAWPNGDRNGTSPGGISKGTTAVAPNLTAFWGNISSLPGHEKGALAAGYETTYDRVRVMSATSAIQLPLWNYDVSVDKMIGIFTGFEADGMFLGYGGCDHAHANFPFFKSTEANGAARIRPDLCPLGKYGYDARCRDWYSVGKKHSEEIAAASLYVTPPYLFAGSSITAQSATLPLVDPKTREHVGQTLLDFSSTKVTSSLRQENTNLVDGGFPILITAETDVLGHDTVIGPGYDVGGDGKRIEELVLSHGEMCSPDGNCGGFHEIANAMRHGGNGTTSFKRTGPDGLKETVHISYAPVEVKSYRPVDESDFSRGAMEFTSLIYSLALAQPEQELMSPFQDVAGDVQKQVNIAIGVLSSLILIATIFLVYVSYRVTVSITVPITQLLSSLRSVNRLENKEDFLPPEDGSGSREVLAVYGTFSMLLKVMRFANSAFFSGDIEKAYLVLVDALRLFKSLDNKKAIGVASNNLGNCMLTMYRTMEAMKKHQICGLSKQDIILKGTTYFRDAIKLGEEAYDKFYEEQGWSGSCLVFMQHLSNRYFNRAVFLLTVRKDHRWPEEAKRLGFRDLDIAKCMDEEIADQCLEVGFAIDKAEWFDLMLSRIRGLLSLKEMEYPDEWDIGELIENIYRALKTALRCAVESDFFREVSPAGRMQQLDTEMVKHAILEGRKEDAARIGIRMLIEDEYAFYEAEATAVKALVDYVQSEGCRLPEISAQVKDDLTQFQRDVEDDFTETISRRFAQSRISEAAPKVLRSHQSANLSSTISRSSTVSLRISGKGDFTMEVF